jgi:hypothetical protein
LEVVVTAFGRHAEGVTEAIPGRRKRIGHRHQIGLRALAPTERMPQAMAPQPTIATS